VTARAVGATGVAATSVAWLRLELHGFGVHESLALEFREGMTVFASPNETGKSTALAGLTAVLFGLPTSNNPNAWGQARFRHHGGVSRFGGLVRFRALDGGSYEIRRNFETHETSLRRLGPGEAQELFAGTHNPGARRGNGRYEKLLDELVGIVSDELFRKTFSIEQPLTGSGGLSAEVAALLAGAAGGSHNAALKQLADAVEGRSRRTSSLFGLPGNDKRNDRELERLESEIEELSRAIEQGRAAADGLQEVQASLADSGRRESALKARQAELEAKLDGTSGWLEAQATYRRKQKELADVEAALGRARSLEGKIVERERPAEAESATVERDWSFVDGKAARAVEDRLADAREALGQYARFQAALNRAAAARERIESFPLLAAAPAETVDELGGFAETRARLEEAARRAREDLERIAGTAAANDPDAGFEDVRDLSPARLQELRRMARARPAAPALALAGAGAALLVGLLLGLDWPIIAVAALALAGVGWWSGALLVKRAGGAGAARELLLRHEQWRRRVETAPPGPDPTHYRERVEQAESELASFLLRIEPFQSEYQDLGAALAEFLSARAELAEQEEVARRYAEDSWRAGPAGVAAVEPDELGGLWRRLASFVLGLDRRPESRGSDSQGWESQGPDSRDWEPPGSLSLGALLASLERMAAGDSWAALARDAEAWDERSRARQVRERDLAELRAELRGLLGGEGVVTVEELQVKAAAGQTEALSALSEFKAVCEAYPELPRHDDPDASREDLLAARNRYSEELAAVEGQVASLADEILELRREQAARQGGSPANVAGLEVELAALRQRRRELEAEAEAYGLAYRVLGAAAREYQDAYLDRLSELASGYFREFTGRPGRRVRFGEGFEIRVQEEAGAELEPQRLSQGAQDQLALAARLAVADMISDNLPLPLILDDPFLNCDAERLARIEGALREVALSRQVILLSHDSSFRSWGEPVRLLTGGALELSG
jgi:DNA repair exonuclease SbcCD ATPase subunit